MGEAIFRGQSGRLYRFRVEVLGGSTVSERTEPGLFIFARPARAGLGWKALHLGRTGNLSLRLDSAGLWDEARTMGGAFVLTLCIPDRAERIAAEADLRAALRPVLDDRPQGAEVVPLVTMAEREALRRQQG